MRRYMHAHTTCTQGKCHFFGSFFFFFFFLPVGAGGQVTSPGCVVAINQKAGLKQKGYVAGAPPIVPIDEWAMTMDSLQVCDGLTGN